MSGRWKIKHPSMRPLALQAREVLPADQVTYVWVPRERNKHADRLANEALDAAARGEQWSASTSRAELDTAAAGDAAEEDAGPPDVPQANRLVGWDGDLGDPMTALLVRHGQTDHTLGKRFSGSGGADPGLTPDGEAQAAAVAAVLADRGGVAAVVTSPLRRARETAEVIADRVGAPMREVADFRECDFGEWDGHTFAEVQEKWPAELAAWLADTTVAPPGGESFDVVRRRVLVARDKLLARYPAKAVVVVTHVTPVKVLVGDTLGAPTTALFRMEMSPASLTEIQWFAGGAASLRRFNDAAHLRT
jgi:probable phosphoglycerate mutase